MTRRQRARTDWGPQSRPSWRRCVGRRRAPWLTRRTAPRRWTWRSRWNRLSATRARYPQGPPPMSNAYDFSFTSIDGDPLPLSSFKGKPVLVVNTASKCGLTPQYEGLEKLWSDYKDKGL